MSRHPKISVGGRWAGMATVAIVAIASCGTEDPSLVAEENPSDGERDGPSCAEITRFADQLVDVGIAYDYQPTSSPAELAGQSDIVFSGTLTGGFDHAAVGGDEEWGGETYVAYEVAVSDVIVPFAHIEPGDEQVVSVAYNQAVNDPGNHDPDDYEAAIAVGAPVVVFAHDATSAYDGVPGGLSASIEGFVTACEGEPPMGWIGSQGEWQDIASLDDLIAAARR